jgi:serine/threonine protein kinase/Tfp pilus assembly protein PilF
MSQLFSPTSEDPAQDVLGEWNLGADPDPDGGVDDSLLRPHAEARRSKPAPAPTPRPAVSRSPLVFGSGRADGEELPFLNFTITPCEIRADLAKDSLHGPGVSATHPHPARPQVSSASEQTLTAPRMGDVISGFRIIAELGRGAFARVYLAEQTDLGDRPVALKVSKVEGDEPQILARLQHTHIVPIHSVHDDAETNLRLLCMPYLGGTNLAQVLEEAGSRPTGGKGGQSLVDALDEASQRYQSGPGSRRSGRESGVAGLASRRSMSNRSAQGPSGPRRFSPAEADIHVTPLSLHRSALAGIHSLWGRFSRRSLRGAEADAAELLDAADFDQPARLFLRHANSIQAAVWIVARLAEGLEHAHTRGMLHCDLKPSNILIAGDGTPMLLDFNLSSNIEPAGREEGEKAMLGGTLPYMAPEHLDAFHADGTTPPEAVDERSDLYSLGLILFEMIAGASPFEEPTQRMALLESVRFLREQRKKAPSLRTSCPDAPWSLDSILRKCLDPNPSRRYARARDLAEDLNRFLEDRPLKFAPEPSLRERFAKLARRNPRLCGNSSIAAFSVMMILSLGGLIGLLHNNMQNLAARLKVQVFRNDFAESRFLLNLQSGPVEHLGRGIERAQKAIDNEQIDASGHFRPESWYHRLTPYEQAAVREQTSELILLLARSGVALAARTGTEAERRLALEWAIPWLDRAERIDPDPPAALYADRARYLSALGRGELAARDWARETKKAPVSSRDHALLGMSALARGDLSRAETSLLRAVELDLRGFWGWFALGHCHYEQGRFQDAAGDFGACVALKPRFAWPHLNRGLSLARTGRLAEASASYRRALQANPRFAEAWLNLALTELEQNNLASAESAIEQAQALGRREAGVLAAWAEIKSRRGDREGAERLFDQLIRETPDDARLLTARGIFRVAFDKDAARSDLRRALALDPHDARAHFGMALALRGEAIREALAEANAALRDDPSLLDALQLRALLRARLGDLAALDDAERLCQIKTPHRLYNSACALAVLVETVGESRLASRALELLDRALDAGFPAAHAATDPDLKPLRALPRFQETLEKIRTSPKKKA